MQHMRNRKLTERIRSIFSSPKKTVSLLALLVILLVLPFTVLLQQQHTAGPTSSSYPANIEFDPPSYPYGTYNQASLTNPDVAGVVVNLSWGAVEPQQGTFNFALADNEIATWVAQGKRAALQVRFLYQGGDPSVPNCGAATTPNDLPGWEIARIQHFCDSDKGMIIPDYFDPTFQADAKAYVSAIAQHYASSPFRSSIIYVRVATGTGGEANLLIPCATTSTTCDYRTDVKQLIAYGYTPTAVLNYEENMLFYYKSVFNYTTVIYGMTIPLLLEGKLNINPATRNQVEFDVAEWAVANRIGIGAEGLVPFSSYSDYMRLNTIIAYVKANYPNTYVQFQTVGRVAGVSAVQGDITNAKALYAKTIEWYGQDTDTPAYQPLFASWQQMVDSKFALIDQESNYGSRVIPAT